MYPKKTTRNLEQFSFPSDTTLLRDSLSVFGECSTRLKAESTISVRHCRFKERVVTMDNSSEAWIQRRRIFLNRRRGGAVGGRRERVRERESERES